MGMFDTMQQGMKSASAMGQAQPMGGTANAMGQGFAQQKPATMGGMNKPKPVGNMQKPNNQMARIGQNVGNAASQFMQNRPGAGGSNSMLQAKQKMQEAQAQGAIAPSDPVQQLQQTLAKQKGGLQSPYDAQQSALQTQQQAAANPMQSAQEQMRGYDGPDLGSQDPRELARMQIGNVPQPQLYGTEGLQAPPFQGGGNPSFQEMFQNAEFSRPDVMPRGGISPSFMEQANPIQMDENGLEPRRGAR